VMLGEDEIATSSLKQAWIEKLEGRIRSMYLEMDKETQQKTPALP
jgi:hypothetical protein